MFFLGQNMFFDTRYPSWSAHGSTSQFMSSTARHHSYNKGRFVIIVPPTEPLSKCWFPAQGNLLQFFKKGWRSGRQIVDICDFVEDKFDNLLYRDSWCEARAFHYVIV